MPSTYDSLLRLELQATGENENTWGEKANTNFELLGVAIAGHVSAAIGGSGNYTLSTANASTDEARRAFITLSGTLTGNRVIIVPSSSKIYAFRRNTTGDYTITVKTSGGTAATLPTSGVALVVCDGTDCWLVEDDTKLPVTGGTLSGAIAVSVSTSTSATAGLKVTQTGTGPVVWFEDAGSDASPFVINNAGQVLIGTSVGYNLVGINDAAMQINRLANTAAVNVATWSEDTAGPSLQLMKSRGATVGAYTTVSIDDQLGSIWWGGDTGTEIQTAAAIRVYVDASVSSSVVPSVMYFQVQSSSGAGALENAMVIKNNGNVGIGTILPQETLHVVGNVRLNSTVVSAPAGTAPGFLARGWGKFDGSGNILASKNVASVVRNATGDYTVTLDTAMVSANYSINITCGNTTGFSFGIPRFETTPTAATFRIQCAGYNGFSFVDFDPAYTSFVVFS